MDKRIGIIGIITLLMGFGGGVMLSINEQNNAYYCEANKEIGIFYGGISKTALTGYPFKENRTQAKTCSTGWVKLESIPQQKEPVKQWICDTEKCIEKR